MTMDADHPVQTLLFFTLDSLSPEVEAGLKRSVDELAESREWTLELPSIVNTADNCEQLGRNDIAGDGMGVAMEMYSAIPPLVVPKDLDQKQFDEVSAVVECLRRFSALKDLRFDVELDQTSVGCIQRGKLDQGLAETLLGEWRRHLNA